MNHSRMRRAAALVAAGALVAGAAACRDITGADCGGPPEMRANDVRTSLNDGTPVATFHFTQDYYGDASSCAQPGGPVQLVISSDANVTQTFGWTARGIDPQGRVHWTVSGTVRRLTSGSAEDEGEIVDSDLPVDAGVRIDLTSWAGD